jgi:hypothetical protein
VCLGCGQLLARAAGIRLPISLLLPSGFAVVIVVAGFAIALPATAVAATPVVVGLAAIGLCLLPRRRPGREARTAATVGVVTFLLFGAPVLFSGDATFAGYVKLDDTATFLAFTDHVLDHGRDLSMLAPSTYEATLAVNVANGYPLGAVLPLGIGAKLVGSDPAWVWQPFISFAAALLAMSLYALAAKLFSRRDTRAEVAVLGSSSALLYGYALWGGVKEVVAAALLALCAATITYTLRSGARALLVPAISCAAFVSVMSLGGAVWLVPLGAAILVAPVTRRLRHVALLGVLGALLAAPVLAEAGTFLRRDNVNSFRSAEELGNLARPLRARQVLGVWPTGDFRADPGHSWLTWLLVGIAGVGLVLGVAHAIKRGAIGVLALGVAAALGACLFVVAGSPWLGGKALAIASPMALFLAFSGYAATCSRSRVLLGAAALLIVGVAWSNLLAYREVWLAPRGQLGELELIGKRFAGRGPALMTEYQPYGARHFLRRLDAEGASELRRRAVRLRTGQVLAKGLYADVDEFTLSELTDNYRLLVLRRSPVASRPSSRYELAFRGAWYDVWRRVDGISVSDRLPLGGALDPLGVASCTSVQHLATLGGRLVTPARTDSSVSGFGTLPAGWLPVGSDSGIVTPTTGTAAVPISVPATGTYGVWVGGSFRGTLRMSVDGVPAGSLSSHLNPVGMWVRTGSVRLATGQHVVTVELTRSRLRPGDGGTGFYLGPVALAQEATGRLDTVAADRASALCGKRLDWIEAN